MFSYQCSQLSTTESVVKVFNNAKRFQKGQDYVSVVVLDEVSLAEVSPNLPLSVLHTLLEDEAESADDLQQVHTYIHTLIDTIKLQNMKFPWLTAKHKHIVCNYSGRWLLVCLMNACVPLENLIRKSKYNVYKLLWNFSTEILQYIERISGISHVHIKG